jgi:hypothetical protein
MNARVAGAIVLLGALAAPSASAGAQPPPAKPSFTLSASGQGGVRMQVTCHDPCTITGSLKVDARTARTLHIGSSRIAGEVERTVDPGTFTLTVKLSVKAKQGFRQSKLVSFKAKLTGAATYPASGVAASKTRTVTITR